MRRPEGAAFRLGAILVGFLALNGACSHTGKSTGASYPESLYADASRNARLPEGYGDLLALLEQDRRTEARGRLEAADRARTPGETGSSAVAFELAAALLVEKTDPARLKAFKQSFERYAESLPPESAARGEADRVVRLLDKRIREADRRLKSTQALHRRAEEQERELEDLEYKLRKLEEIQQETETRREDFLHK